MAETKAADTVPNLGFKDKEKALETIKILEGRDPDYQRLAIKGLVGRANRVLGITKAEDKLNNIKEAINIFEDWLKNFEKLNLSKENMTYLPIATVKVFTALGKKYGVENNKFIDDYEKKAEGDYKKLRTVESDKDKPTWDIVRNTNLKQLLKKLNAKEQVEYWDDDGLPTKEHVQLILWAYSPEATKIKKSLESLKEKIEKIAPSTDEISKTASKRKSNGDTESDESPQKKKRSSDESTDEDSSD